MTETPSLLFLLDTPNIWRGRALAGTPARTLALAEHAHRAGASVTLVLCDRGADYGLVWPCDTVLVHPADFYDPAALAAVVEPRAVDFVVVCEAEAMLKVGAGLSRRLGARSVYDVHDDDAGVSRTLGEPESVVHVRARTQRAALEVADFVVVSTRNELALAVEVCGEDRRIVLLPNGADTALRTCWGPDLTSTPLLTFLGNLYYEPNARAVEAIRTAILPRLSAAGLDVRVRVVGRGPAAVTADPRIEFTGRADTVDAALRGTTLALAPLTAGSGAKMKVLDYMAAGLPVLGTGHAVTGLPVDHPGVVVDDDMRQWPRLIAELLADPAALRRIGTDGRACVETELSWSRIGTDLLRATWSWRLDPPRADRSRTHHFGTPRWLTEHATQDALGEPIETGPGRPCWLRRSDHDACDVEGRPR
ncbi:glycosyltransferase family 4 protein [Nocardia sp. NPDC047038]|uniref:glycosyltransferase family 4 protein n=1 Tax=Nocardia sp. NPDC047038 TaxID=3154338 RepID=UPI0033E2E644